MTLDQIQSTLQIATKAIPSLAAAQDCVFIDDGLENSNMDDKLMSKGIAVLVHVPQGHKIFDQVKKSVSIIYVTSIWIRTNPNSKTNNIVNWNPLTVEQQLIPKVLKLAPPNEFPGQQPFFIPDRLEPETDFADQGINSRLVRFGYKMVY